MNLFDEQRQAYTCQLDSPKQKEKFHKIVEFLNDLMLKQTSQRFTQAAVIAAAEEIVAFARGLAMQEDEVFAIQNRVRGYISTLRANPEVGTTVDRQEIIALINGVPDPHTLVQKFPLWSQVGEALVRVTAVRATTYTVRGSIRLRTNSVIEIEGQTYGVPAMFDPEKVPCFARLIATRVAGIRSSIMRYELEEVAEHQAPAENEDIVPVPKYKHWTKPGKFWVTFLHAEMLPVKFNGVEEEAAHNIVQYDGDLYRIPLCVSDEHCPCTKILVVEQTLKNRKPVLHYFTAPEQEPAPEPAPLMSSSEPVKKSQLPMFKHEFTAVRVAKEGVIDTGAPPAQLEHYLPWHFTGKWHCAGEYLVIHWHTRRLAK